MICETGGWLLQPHLMYSTAGEDLRDLMCRDSQYVVLTGSSELHREVH